MRQKNLMTRVVVALLFVAVVKADVLAKDFSDIPVEWAAEPVVIDGKISDWSELSTRFLYEPEAVIGLASDSTHLYLMLRFQDSRWARMIKTAGLKFWLDPHGKKKDIFMIKFRGGPTQDQMQLLDGGAGDRGGHGPGDRMNPGGRPEGDTRLFTCAIKDRIEEKDIPVDGTEGPQAAFGLDQGFFVYEFSIPLDEGGVRHYGLGVEPGDRISIGVFWGDMSEMRRRGGRRGGSMPGGGMPGGTGGGPGGTRGGDRPERPEPVEFWIKTKLADQVESE